MRASGESEIVRFGRQSCGRHVRSPKGARNRVRLDVKAAGDTSEVQKEQETVPDWTPKQQKSKQRSKAVENCTSQQKVDTTLYFIHHLMSIILPILFWSQIIQRVCRTFFIEKSDVFLHLICYRSKPIRTSSF